MCNLQVVAFLTLGGASSFSLGWEEPKKQVKVTKKTNDNEQPKFNSKNQNDDYYDSQNQAQNNFQEQSKVMNKSKKSGIRKQEEPVERYFWSK